MGGSSLPVALQGRCRFPVDEISDHLEDDTDCVGLYILFRRKDWL